MLIYITMFIYGAMVMRGVMEEKTNRIAEVMVSSVKPFQLMSGKDYWDWCSWIDTVFYVDHFDHRPVINCGVQAFIPHEIVMEQVKTLCNRLTDGMMPGGGMMKASEAAAADYTK